MRSRVTWTMVVSGVVLIGIRPMHFSLTALQEPGALETRIANLAKHSVIRLASRHGIPPPPPRARVRSRRYTFRPGLRHMPTVGPKRHRGSGCTHVPQISPVSECGAIRIRRYFGSSTTASDSQGCRASANLRRRITFGVWSNTCERYRVQSRG